MPQWQSSTRRARLPKSWHQLRQRVKRRAGGRCEWTERGVRCPAQGNQCDHIIAGDDHSLANLQWLCAKHHAIKSSREGGAGGRGRRRRMKRPAEPHPGFKTK